MLEALFSGQTMVPHKTRTGDYILISLFWLLLGIRLQVCFLYFTLGHILMTAGGIHARIVQNFKRNGDI